MERKGKERKAKQSKAKQSKAKQRNFFIEKIPTPKLQ